ncbi:MAG: hypothetical protein VKL60_18670 [Sphaerospermopsis sp.]|nr:hypothetical protein [Sphaerospermopsis sp.]
MESEYKQAKAEFEAAYKASQEADSARWKAYWKMTGLQEVKNQELTEELKDTVWTQRIEQYGGTTTKSFYHFFKEARTCNISGKAITITETVVITKNKGNAASIAIEPVRHDNSVKGKKVLRKNAIREIELAQRMLLSKVKRLEDGKE